MSPVFPALSGSGSVSTGSLSKCCMPHVCPASSPSPASPSTSSSTLFFWRCCLWTSTGSWWGSIYGQCLFVFTKTAKAADTIWSLSPLLRVVHCGFRGEGAEDEGGERRQGVRGRGRQQGSSGPAQKTSGGKQRWWCWTSHLCPGVSFTDRPCHLFHLTERPALGVKKYHQPAAVNVEFVFTSSLRCYL